MADVTTATPELRLERVNTPPAQTWNYLRANDITLTVPNESRKGDVYFALPRLFESIDCGMGPDVTAWIESQAADAQYVEVRAGEKRTEPILASMDTGVMVRAGAEATIVVCPEALTDAPGPKGSTPIGSLGPKGSTPIGATSAALVRVIAEKGARVQLFEFVAVDDDQQHLESVGITADEGARVEVRQYFLGAHTTAAGLSCALNGANARFDLTCRYLGTGEQRLDINHVVSMRGRNGRSNLRESGVLDGRAHKTLRATIDLVHGSSGSEGAELENVLVLSDDVVNKTMPVILCDEDDVAGNHGATIGSIGPDQIQYLADRGLSLEEAEALYVRALFDEALIAAPTAAVRTAVLARAQTVLGPEVAGDLVEALQLDAEDQA
jgi:Fe-S cluster assembly scaffold protein SufB